MNYRIAQNPDLPDVLEMERPLSTVNPIETFGNSTKPAIETDVSYSKLSGLSFPSSYAKVAESLTKLGVKVNENSLKGRWLKNYIEPALEGVDCPLWKENGITEFGFNAIAEILQRCVLAGLANVAPQTLRDELIERYGVKPVKDSLKDSLDLLERSKAIKTNADEKREAVALARVLAIDEIETLKEGLQTLNASQEDDEPYELTEQEKARLLKRQLSKQIAEQEYLQQVARGEV